MKCKRRHLPVFVDVELGMIDVLEECNACDTIIFKLALSSPPVSILVTAKEVRQQIRVAQDRVTDQTVQELLQGTAAPFDKLFREPTCVLFFGQGWEYDGAKLVDKTFVQPFELAVATFYRDRHAFCELERIKRCQSWGATWLKRKCIAHI